MFVEVQEHGGRQFVHLQTWNRHRKLLKWYPGKRFFTIPQQNVAMLADALQLAAEGVQRPKPEWLVRREHGIDEPWLFPDEKVA